MVLGIRIGQDAFVASYDGYANISAPHPVAIPGVLKSGWAAPGCPAACGRSNITACNSFECIGFASGADVHFRYVSPAMLVAGVPEFAIGAQADLDGAPPTSSFSFQSGNAPGSVIGAIVDGISSCGLVAADELFDCTPFDW